MEKNNNVIIDGNEVIGFGQIFNCSLGDDIDHDKIMVDYYEGDDVSEALFKAGFKPGDKIKVIFQRVTN